MKPSKSDCGTQSFAQPGQQAEFCFLTIQSLQVLSLTHYNFLKNDTLKIRFTTRFERYSSRQRASILLQNGRLVSEFNWLIPGLVAKFERYMQESVTLAAGVSFSTSAQSNASKTHKFVSDEFYTNGQGYLCQLVLTVTLKNVPMSINDQVNEVQNNNNNKLSLTTNSGEVTLPTYNYNQTENSKPFQSHNVLLFGLELIIIEGEYDRLLKWPFSAAYELSIVSYKDLSTSGSIKNSNSYSDLPKLYNLMGSPAITKQQQDETTNNNQKTSSILVIPSNQVDSGQCAKESFQKPIERNPPCGERNLVRLVNSVAQQQQQDDQIDLNHQNRKERKHDHYYDHIYYHNSKSTQQSLPFSSFSTTSLSPIQTDDDQKKVKIKQRSSSSEQRTVNNQPSPQQQQHSHYELETLTSKMDEDLHLRIRIYL